jgi:hypothetical protein
LSEDGIGTVSKRILGYMSQRNTVARMEPDELEDGNV